MMAAILGASACKSLAGNFEPSVFTLMGRVARTREAIVVTERSRPVAKLVPTDDAQHRPPFYGYMAGKGEIRGDIVKVPVPKPVAWTRELVGLDEPDLVIDSASLPNDMPRDPVDRFLVPTARASGATLVMRHERILAFAETGQLKAMDA